MSKKKPKIWQTAKTTDNKPVMAGGFFFVGSVGLPLEYLIDRFDRAGWVVDWPEYIQTALNDGHKLNTIRGRILEAIGDIFGPVYKEEYIKHLDKYIHEAYPKKD